MDVNTIPREINSGIPSEMERRKFLQNEEIISQKFEFIEFEKIKLFGSNKSN